MTVLKQRANQQQQCKKKQSMSSSVMQPITTPPLLQGSRLTGGGSPNLVGLVERKGPVERFMGARKYFPLISSMTAHLCCTDSWSKLVLAAFAPTLLCARLSSLRRHRAYIALFTLLLQLLCPLLQNSQAMLSISFKEGVKKTHWICDHDHSWWAGGGGSEGGDHTLIGFFSSMLLS